MAKEVRRCVIISGAPENDIAYIKDSISNTFVICADSGYLKAQRLGIKPDLIIGDFDSANEPEYDCEIIRLPVEKDHTDTFECVITAINRGYNDITIVGAIGSRFDHNLSNLLCLNYCFERDVKCRIINESNRISLISGSTRIYCKDYKWFSLFAFMCDAKGVSISGAHYTAGFYGKEKLNFKPFDQFGQSNFIEGDFCDISVDEGVLLLIESND